MPTFDVYENKNQAVRDAYAMLAANIQINNKQTQAAIDHCDQLQSAGRENDPCHQPFDRFGQFRVQCAADRYGYA